MELQQTNCFPDLVRYLSRPIFSTLATKAGPPSPLGLLHSSYFWHLPSVPHPKLPPFWDNSISWRGQAVLPKNPPRPHISEESGRCLGGGGEGCQFNSPHATCDTRIFGYHKNIYTALFLPESSASDSPSRIRKMSWWWSSCRDTNYQPKNFLY